MTSHRIIGRLSSPRVLAIATLALALTPNVTRSQPARGSRPVLATAVRAFVQIDTPTIALTHVRVIDGTGAPARADQTIVIRDGMIVAVGTGTSVQVPTGAQVLDLSGKSVIPGLVMVHEH